MDKRKFKSQEHREKISQTLKEYFKVHQHPNLGKTRPKEFVEAMSKHLKEYYKTHKHPAIGRHLSEESKKRVSEAHRGKTLSEEHKRKIGESVLKWHKEIGISPETRKRISEKQKGKIISEETRRKISQANYGKKAWNKGLTTKTDKRVKKGIESRTKTIKKLYSEGKLKPWNLGKKWSQEIKDKISLKRKGKTYEEIMGQEKAAEFKKKLSKMMKQRVLGKLNPMYGKFGELNPHFGKPAAHGKNEFRRDLGHFCHSKWEANYCRYLLWNNKKYAYEPKTFILVLPDGKKTSYTPDFLVENEWQELKGWENRSETKKWEIFQQQYPNEKFVLINRDKYKSIEKVYQFIIPNWEH